MPESALESLRALVVEDNAPMRTLIRPAMSNAIAGELCRYLDALSQVGVPPQAADEATRLCGTVAEALAMLVDKKLADVNASETRPLRSV